MNVRQSGVWNMSEYAQMKTIVSNITSCGARANNARGVDPAAIGLLGAGVVGIALLDRDRSDMLAIYPAAPEHNPLSDGGVSMNLFILVTPVVLAQPFLVYLATARLW